MARLESLAVEFPETVRTNAWFEERFPDVVADAHRRSLHRVFTPAGAPVGLFDAEMRPHLDDPFRGSVERRSLGSGSALDLQASAARRALEAAQLEAGDIDLLISVAFLPERRGIGNAVFLAERLGIRANAWNLESACAGPMSAMQAASALVDAGAHRRVLVAVVCNYTQVARPDDSISWFLGDGAGAFVIGADRGAEVLGVHLRQTADTCGSWYHELEAAPEPRVTMRASPQTGRLMRASAEPHLLECCHAVTRRVGLALDDIHFFVFHTPTAWFARFAARALAIDPERTLTTYPEYANVGPALLTTNLHRAAQRGLLPPGGNVLVYSPGSASAAGAAVLRWSSSVGLAPPPSAPRS